MRSTQTSTDSSTLFVISSADENLLRCNLETWLNQRDDFFIFSNYKPQSVINQSVFQKFHLYSHWALIRSQSLYVNQFSNNGNEPDWYIFASDNSLVLINQLKLELSALDSTYAFHAILAEEDEQKTQQPNSLVPITILSRGALSMLMRQIRSQSSGCGAVEGSLNECLKPSVKLNLQRDSQKRNRFLIITRHFGVSEMKDFQQANGGNYTDSSQIFGSISPKLISFHRATCEDMKLISILTSKVRRPRSNRFQQQEEIEKKIH